MFTGDLNIDCVPLPRRHTHWTLSLSLFSYSCASPLSQPLACYAGKYAWTSYKVFQSPDPPPHPVCSCTPPSPPSTTKRSYYPTISNLSISLTTLTHRIPAFLSSAATHSVPMHLPPPHPAPHTHTLPLLSSFSFHASLSFSPSQSVWVSEFPLQCRIPRLINRYAGMIGIGQQAAPVIPESCWDYGVQLSVLHEDLFIVQYHCPVFQPCLAFVSTSAAGKNNIIWMKYIKSTSLWHHPVSWTDNQLDEDFYLLLFVTFSPHVSLFHSKIPPYLLPNAYYCLSSHTDMANSWTFALQNSFILSLCCLHASSVSFLVPAAAQATFPAPMALTLSSSFCPLR